ncbi:hypothetical protein EU537_11975 [Candidatus Thorarchaeota archaeon]|nr:MAG: hypothetical protein EU537_11975 [Candidatus Thorarchaeota archaeon]
MKVIHNRNPMLLCLLGGILMIASGIGGSMGYLVELEGPLQNGVDSALSMTLDLIMAILTVLTALAGLGLIIAGFILTTKYVEPARYAIIVTVGTGVLSLTMSLVQLAMAGVLRMDLTVQLVQSLGWIGAMFGVIARVVSKQQSIVSN